MNNFSFLIKQIRMNRITINSRVSTEGWRFDTDTSDDERLSYLIFGENWRDSRLNGTVKARSGGDKRLVEWDIDKTKTEISTEYLCGLTVLNLIRNFRNLKTDCFRYFKPWRIK